MRRILLILLLLSPLSAFASGTCPSGNLAIDVTNIAGPRITYTAAGVTQCNYIDSVAGSDSNTGSDEAHPWQHLPHMATCTGTCASHTIVAGDGFIIKGGSQYGNSDLKVDWQNSGTSTHPLYVGNDPTWANAITGTVNCSGSTCTWQTGVRAPYSCTVNGTSGTCSGDFGYLVGGDTITINGSSFTLASTPTETASNVIALTSAPGTLTGVAFSYTKWTRPILDEAGAGTQNFWQFQGTNQWNIVDHIEMRGGRNNINGFLMQSSSNNKVVDIYFHKISHTGSSDNVGVASQCGTNSGIYLSVLDDEDGSKNTYNGVYSSCYEVAYNVIRYMVSQILATGNLIHDNLIENPVISADGDHANGLFNFGASSGNNVLEYNNLVRHTSGCSGCVNWWMAGNNGPNPSFVGYAFGNVEYDVNTSNVVNMFAHATGNYGSVYYLNNTVQCGTNSSTTVCLGGADSGKTFTINLFNNHFITGSAVCGYGAGQGSCATPVTDLVQTVAAANSAGYNSTTNPAWYPSSGAAPTVGAGTDETIICTAVSAINTAAGTACLNGTSYSGTYSTLNNTVSFPANPLVSRGTWDIGAYQFTGSSGTVANPVFSPAAGSYTGAQNIGISTTTPGAAICYRCDGTNPAATTPGTCDAGSTTYTGPFSISTTQTCKALGTLASDTNSAIISAAYTITANAPTCSPVAGTYNSTQNVSLSTTLGGVICYTTNGSTPATNSTTGCTAGTLYSTAVAISTTSTLKSIAGGTGNADSTVTSCAYTITTSSTGKSLTTGITIQTGVVVTP